MNALSYSIMQRFVDDYDLRDGKVVVDVGAMDWNGTYRGLFGTTKYIGADIAWGNNVDVLVGSDGWYALKGVDAVISGSTFEHVEDEALLLMQIESILKPGGLVCIQAPSSGPMHDCPKWYRHYTEESMAGILRDAGFSVVAHSTDPDPEFRFVTCIASKPDTSRKSRKSKEAYNAY